MDAEQSTAPFSNMNDPEAGLKPVVVHSRKRSCGFFTLGCVSLALLMATVCGAGLYMLDKKGFQIGITDKDAATTTFDDDDVDEMMDDIDVEEEEAGSEWALPKLPFQDKDSGVMYPPILKATVTDAKIMQGLGAGTRVKKIGPISVTVYSVGLYVEPEGAREALADFEGHKPSALREDASFYDAVEEANFDRAVRIVMKRDVTRSQMVEGIADSLRPQIKRVAAGREDELIKKFNDLVKVDSFKNGQVMVISRTGDLFAVTLDDATHSLEDADMCKAFFAVYTHSDTPAPAARAHFADKVPLLWVKNTNSGSGSGDAVAEPATIELTTFNSMTVTEKFTTKEFAVDFTVASSTSDDTLKMDLAGVAKRVKSYLPFGLWDTGLYAAGMYVDLEKWTEFRDEHASGKKYDLLMQATDVTRGVLVNMARDIDSATFIAAFASAMQPALQAQIEDADDLDRAMLSFRNLFPLELHENDVLYFHCSADALSAVVKGVSKPAITEHARELCSAITQVYLGSDSVVGDEGRKALVQRLL